MLWHIFETCEKSRKKSHFVHVVWWCVQTVEFWDNYKRLPMNICFSNSTSLIIGLLTFAVVIATGDYFYNLAARVPFYVTYSDNTPAVNRHLLWKIILPKVLLSSFGNFSPVKLYGIFFFFFFFSLFFVHLFFINSSIENYVV